MADKRYVLEWHLPALNFAFLRPTKGMVWYGTFLPKFIPRMADKRYALEWHLPALKFCPRVAHERYATLK